MKIDRIQIEGFGRLAGLDTGPDSLEGLVVVLGPNEAGKSTLFSFLTTAFYGFQPATREGNPHVPWGAPEASGRVRIRLDGGGCADVERKLRSQPTGRLTIEGGTTELRNQPLPWVEHVPRGVFRQVFAVTLAELAGLDGETWARIQDNVVGSMGASDLRSARTVADTLDREAGEIWRPNRRGNQRLRALQLEARLLRGRRGVAQERDHRVRAILNERDAVQARLEAARAERHRDMAAVERAQTLLPLRRQIDRVASLRAEGGDRGLLAGLPSEPIERLSSLEAARDATQTRRDSLDAELAAREASVAEFDTRARTLLAKREDIARLVARAAGCTPDRAQAGQLEAEVRDIEARLDVAGERLLEGPWRDQEERLAKVSAAVLKDRLERVVPEGPVDSGPPSAVWMSLPGLVVGSAILAWGVTVGRLLPSALGAGLAAVAVAALLSRALRTRRRHPQGTEAGPEGLAPPLAGLRLHPDHRNRMTESLVTGLARLQDLLHDRAEAIRALATARSRVAEVDAEAALVGRELGLDHTLDADGVALHLGSALRRAERSQDAAEQARRESGRLLRERQSADGELAGLDSTIATLRSAGAAISGGDPIRGLEHARARMVAHRRADELEEELRRGHGSLDELEGRVAAAARTHEPLEIDDAELAQARARIEAVEEEIERLVRRGEALERDAAHLHEMETVDAVDSEIATLREAEVRLARERDRKWVLARILREADRRFREEHQPDLLKRAGTYLAHLTGGRYERLVVDETDMGHLFRLVGPGLPAPVALASPVSTGTLEQAYLSLRLAIVDHLDRGGERLPLFVDEVFVNWDSERRARGLEVLAGIARTRQVFVFTCHPSVAEELGRSGARILSLGRSG